MRQTVRWYLENAEWLSNVTSGAYQQWTALNYAARG
jgi:dTDP-glucose 4,6-dehydratase